MLDRTFGRLYNVFRTKIKTKVSHEESNKIRELYSRGISIADISQSFGVGSSCVVQEIRKDNKISELPESYIKILNDGYVGLVNVFGTELDIVNAARVSYDKQSTEFNKRDAKLIKFLLKEGHTSPFRHVSLTFECYVPLMVARQHWKYAVSSTFVDDQNGWNESSRRYITESLQFYTPKSWRNAPENSKQGSGADFSNNDSEWLSNLLDEYVNVGERLYEFALGQNVAPEQARLFLPAYGMFVRYRWTISLAGILNFLDQRLEHDAQYEIQELAVAVKQLVEPHFPTTLGAYFESKN